MVIVTRHHTEVIQKHHKGKPGRSQWKFIVSDEFIPGKRTIPYSIMDIAEKAAITCLKTQELNSSRYVSQWRLNQLAAE